MEELLYLPNDDFAGGQISVSFQTADCADSIYCGIRLKRDVALIVKAVLESGYAFDALRLFGRVKVQDIYGEPANLFLTKMGYEAQQAKRIRWEKFDQDQILRLARWTRLKRPCNGWVSAEEQRELDRINEEYRRSGQR